MLDTPNCSADRVFPVWLMPSGDDGKRKPFHVIHCLAQPTCEATLRLSPGKHSQLPPECVAKFAEQKGWLADKRGYALCPEHNPRNRRNGSPMPPGQKRAAFLAIRDRNLAAAAERMLRPAKPVGSIAKEVAAVRAKVEAAKAEPVAPELVAFADALNRALNGNERTMFRFVGGHSPRIWKSRREAANAGGFNIWTFNGFVEKAIRLGFLVQEPVAGRENRPFRLRLVDKFDPPAIQPEPKESAMSEAVVAPVARAEPPPEPTQEDNRRIRDFLDGHFDDRNGRWTGDLSDKKAAERLGVPRAWVSRIREFYGPNISEADDRTNAVAAELTTRAAEIEATALDLATRAETLGRDVRRFLDGRAL